jgi:pantetheine-phosphate adenylyltransferase
MITAVYPGSFDPVTLGHFDIIKRASYLFDRVVIGVLNNSSKKQALFSKEERVIMLEETVAELPNVFVRSFDGLVVDFAREQDAHIIVRGLRAMGDFDIELQMAQSNHIVAPDVDTLFLSTSVEYSYLSSSMVKEYAYYGASVKDFVPANVLPKIEEKIHLMKVN